MPRRLGDDINELRIEDNISGSDIVLFYRMPTTAERAAYANESFRRQGRKLKVQVGQARQKYGLKILEGIRQGDFEVKKQDQYVPLSSDPKSEYFDSSWKKHIQAHAADLLELLAMRVFDVPAVMAEADEDIDTGEEDAEKNLPGT